MKRKTIISSYPITVVIGNYRWQPGVNIVGETEWEKIHWASVERDQRLRELMRPFPKLDDRPVVIKLPTPA